MRIPLIGDTRCECPIPVPMPYGCFEPPCWACVKCGRNATSRVEAGEVQPPTGPAQRAVVLDLLAKNAVGD